MIMPSCERDESRGWTMVTLQKTKARQSILSIFKTDGDGRWTDINLKKDRENQKSAYEIIIIILPQYQIMILSPTAAVSAFVYLK